MLQFNNYKRAMEPETIKKNGTNLKSLISKGNNVMIVLLSFFIFSCGSSKKTPKTPAPSIYEAIFVSEERGTNFESITTDADFVASPGYIATRKTFATTNPSKNGVLVYPYTVIALSADNKEIGYIANRNVATNVMQKSAVQAGFSTQLTFRTDVRGFTFSPDGQRLFFNEYRNGNTGIYMMNIGSTIIQQITPSGSNDNVPSMSKNNILFFDRSEGGGFDFGLWGYDIETRLFSNYSQGYSPCVDPSNNNIVYFTRNTNENIFTTSTSSSSTTSSSSVTLRDIFVTGITGAPSSSTTPQSATQSKNINSRRSEIWRFDTETGREEVILSDPTRSFSSPQASSDGRWILVTGVNKTTDGLWNADIFVVRSDGTNLTQLTYHPGNDLSAIWSADGRNIFFVSQRGTSDGKYNVWRMNFALGAY